MIYMYDISVNVDYALRLSVIVYNFFDKLKSHTKGYASIDYEFIGNRESLLVMMDILRNREHIDALSVIVHRDFAYERGKRIVEKLKDLLRKQQFERPVQAAIGNKIMSRYTLK